jgi:hypothetical protein
MDLSRDVTGYAINPHTDTAKKLVTTLYYLPKTDEIADQGTLVVKSLAGKIVKSGSGRASWDNMEVIRQAKFLPNSMLAFAPCQASWHAVKRTDTPTQRDTIQGFVHLTKGALRKSTCLNQAAPAAAPAAAAEAVADR